MRALRSAGTIRSNLTKILIGALVPMAFLGAWQGMLTYQDSRKLVSERLRASAWGIAESERDPFIIARHSLQMVGQLDVVKRMGPGCDQLMSDARNGATGIINFVRTDRIGAVRCSGLPFQPGATLAQNPVWQRAARDSSFVLGGRQIGEISRMPVVLVFLPLFDERGAFDGTVSAGVSLGRLSETLKSRQRALGGTVVLVDRQGRIVLSEGPSQFDAIPTAAAGLLEPQTLKSRDGRHWTFVAAPMFERDLLVIYAEPRANFANAALSRIWLILALPLLAGALSLAGIWFATQRYLLDWFPRLHGLTERIAEERPIEDRGDFAAAPTEIADIAEDLHETATKLSLSRAALQRAFDTQKSLTRELNHRVRNNIQIIVSLLTMQSEKAPDEPVREILDQARARVSAIGVVHRYMYDQDEDRLGEVAAAQLLFDLCAQIRTSSRRSTELELQVDADAHCRITFDHAVPLVLFALEAITAAAQGTHRINVALRSEEHGCRLEVTDDLPGTGVPHGDCELLGALAEQMGGHFGSEQTGAGTTTWLEFVPG